MPIDYTEMRQSTDPVLHGRYVAALEDEVAELRNRVARLDAPDEPPAEREQVFGGPVTQ